MFRYRSTVELRVTKVTAPRFVYKPVPYARLRLALEVWRLRLRSEAVPSPLPFLGEKGDGGAEEKKAEEE